MVLSATGPVQQEPAEPTEEPTWRRHVRIFGPILLNPSADIDAETRRAAALELHALGKGGVLEAVTVLARGLESEQPLVVDAVVDVLSEEPEPLPALLDPTIEALRSGDARLIGRLSAILARYGRTGLDRLDAVAVDPENDIELRLGATRAIAAFHDRDAAGRLVALLNGDPQERQEVVDAACDSLNELTGLPYGRDVDRWLTWWETAGKLPAEDWMRLMMTTLSERIAALEREVQSQIDQRALTEEKLVAVFGELYPALSIDEQLRRLPELLEDPLPRLRQFAVGRVARLLRDSVRIPLEVQGRLAERLQDEQPEVRRQAVELLDELDYPRLARSIAARLDDETDADVTETYLVVLEKRPVMSALGPLGRRLTQPSLGDRAAESLWAHLTTLGIDDDGRVLVGGLVASAIEYRQLTPPLARLHAYLVGEEALDEVVELLDDEDPALVRAVAEGLAFSGRTEPLNSRSTNEAVYPALIGALARESRDPADARSVVLLTPPPGATESWVSAVRAVAGLLDTADLLAIDSDLAGLSHTPLTLRRDVLRQAFAGVDDDPADERRLVIIERLAPMLITLGEVRAAHAMLVTVDDADLTPALTEMRFEAALLAEAYDAASRWQSDPAAWVRVFAALVAEDSDAAGRLRDEILTRFVDLAGETRTEFENASRRLGDDPSGDSASAAVPPIES